MGIAEDAEEVTKAEEVVEAGADVEEMTATEEVPETNVRELEEKTEPRN